MTMTVLNILNTPIGQLGLVLLFVIALVAAARIIDKRAKKRQRKPKNKV